MYTISNTEWGRSPAKYAEKGAEIKCETIWVFLGSKHCPDPETGG